MFSPEAGRRRSAFPIENPGFSMPVDGGPWKWDVARYSILVLRFLAVTAAMTTLLPLESVIAPGALAVWVLARMGIAVTMHRMRAQPMTLQENRRHFAVAAINPAGHTAARCTNRHPQLARNGQNADMTETSRSRVARPVMVAIAIAHKTVWRGGGALRGL